MDIWFRKYLGRGQDVYQNLQWIKEDLADLEPQLWQDQASVVAEYLNSGETHIYFPPGSELIAERCQAVRCPQPKFDTPEICIHPVDLS
ncbi:hypothetical protein ACQKEK_13520 [Pseudomonas sp. NPDC077408]|tara:strand:- start:1248 stop:1514 length:267 start_codon:yes stop_codon:yes gene_type:complete